MAEKTPNKFKQRLKYIVFLVLIAPICFELALRILGYGGYTNVDYSIRSTPNFCLTSSAEYGFGLKDGVYSVSINGGPAYQATHKKGERITSTSTDTLLPKIFLMGCSFTYGMSVNDEESFPFLLQQAFPSYSVRNFGVPGFGTVQSYLQLKSKIEDGDIPEIVVINFCDFHSDRNSLIPSFRRSLVLGYKNSNRKVDDLLQECVFPFVQNGQLAFEKYDDLYTNWFGRETFASIHYLQSMNDKYCLNELDLTENTLKIFSLIQNLCASNHIELVVTGLTRSEHTKMILSRLNQLGVNTDYSTALDLTRNRYNSQPYDSHPNATAHLFFAKRIQLSLEKLMQKKEANL